MSVADLKVKMWFDGDQFDSGLKKMRKKFNATVRKMERTGQKLTRSVTVPVGIMAGAAVKAAVDFEDAFAGVRKTVDATEGEFQNIRRGILNMSKVMPTAAGEIAGVAEAAGQLGIKTDAILDFSKTMVMLGDTTNLTAEQAATSLARIANVMQLPQDQFDEMGSVIVDLGNNFATTEAEITDFAQRISGAGQIADMAASDIFGIATAMTSVGVEAGLGGTAVQKVLLSINKAIATGSKELDTFASTAGMSAEQFRTAWQEDAGQAFASFVNGLGKQGDQAASTLEELGLADQRLMRAFLSLANAGDLVNRTLETGRNAWKENNALSEEAQKRYKTLASRLEMLKNRVIAMGVSIGDALMPAVEGAIGFITNLTEAFENMSSSAKARILLIAGLLAAGGPLLLALTKVIKVVKTLAMVATSKFTLIAAAVGLAITIGKNLVDNWGVIKAELANLWDGIKLAAWTLADVVTGAIVGMADNTLSAIQSVASALQPSLVPAIGGARAAMANVGDFVKSNMTDAREQFDKSTDTAIKARKSLVGLGESFNSLTGYVNNLFMESTGLDSLLGMWETKFSDVGGAAEDAAFSMAEFNRQVFKTQQKRLEEFVSSNTGQISDVQGLGRGLERAESKFKGAAEASGVFGEKTSAALMFTKQIADDFTNSFGQGMANVIVAGENLIGVLKNIGKLLASSVIQKGIQLLLSGGLPGIGGFFGSGGGLFGAIFGRDIGGPVVKSQPYLIGKGPHQELFIPDRSGSVVPNSKLRGSMGGHQALDLNISGDFRIKGTDLVLSLERARNTYSR